MMQAPPPGAEPIVVNLTPPEVKVAAGGEPVEITANVRNAGTIVDQYSIEIENLDPSWYTITVQSVSLFPGDSAPIPIRLHPPKGSNTRAGHYTFVVRARSHADPTLVGVTKGVVQVGSYSIFQVELAPKRVTAFRGKYRLTLSNGGNSEVQLELTGRDPESDLKYGFKTAEPVVQPGNKLVVPVTVRPQGLRFVGQQRKYQFMITARPMDGDEKDARAVDGELMHKPPLRTWRRPFLGTLIFLLLLWFLTPARPNLCLLPPPVGPWACQFGSYVGAFFRPGTSIARGEATATPVLGRSVGATIPEAGEFVFKEGFELFHNALPDVVGNPRENEWNDLQTNAHQNTTNGHLLFIRETGELYFASKNKLYQLIDGRPYEFQNGRAVPINN